MSWWGLLECDAAARPPGEFRRCGCGSFAGRIAAGRYGGTGGDNRGTFNISTAAAFVIAGAGVRVAKHGNRSISSRSGSADVLEALGVNLVNASERAGETIMRIGIGFLFAPAMHTAMKHAMAARREAGGRTVFNLLGPLTNPAGAKVQVIGVPLAIRN